MSFDVNKLYEWYSKALVAKGYQKPPAWGELDAQAQSVWIEMMREIDWNIWNDSGAAQE